MAGHTDLTRTTGNGFSAINGQPVLEVARTTLASGAAYVSTCDRLEPIVRILIGKIEAAADTETFDAMEGAKLLSLCASVLHKVSAASTGLLRATEGLGKLAILLDAGSVKRKTPGELTKKELIATLVETLKQVAKDGPCPICTIDVAGS